MRTIATHEEFIDFFQNENDLTNLKFENIYDLDMDDPHIICARNKKIRNCVFDGCTLYHVAFENIKIEESYFKDCRTNGLNFINSSLYHTRFLETWLSFAKFTNCHIWSCEFSSCNLGHSEFLSTGIRYSTLVDTDLWGVDLSGANMDFSTWELSCNTLQGTKVNDRLVCQLLYHALRLNISACSSEIKEDIDKIRKLPIARKFRELYHTDIIKEQW